MSDPTEKDTDPAGPGVFAFLMGWTGSAFERLKSNGAGGLVATPPDRSAPFVYFNAAQLAAAGAKTDVQATPLAIPPGATSATMFVKYVAGVGATNPNARADIFLGAANPGAVARSTDAVSYIFDVDPNGFERAYQLGDIGLGASASIGVQAWENGDQAHPGQLSIRFVFR